MVIVALDLKHVVRLARSGFTVLLTGRDPNKGNMAVNKLVNNEGLDVIFYLLDVTNKDHIKTISKQIEQQDGTDGTGR